MRHRREFLTTALTATGLVVARPALAWADRIRILPPGDRRPAAREPNETLARFVAGVVSGETRAHGALRVFWLRAPDAALPFPIRTLAEAGDAGDLVIAERERATVNTLAVENRGKTPVLLLAGEVLAGGKQDRVVAEDVLLPGLSGALGVAVYCVEEGRWTGERGVFKAQAFAPPALRQRVQESRAQREVWAEVRRYAASSAAASPTGRYLAVESRPDVRARQDDVTAALGAPPADAHGAAVFAGTRFTGLDLFGAPALFAREWPKLLRAHAVETSAAAGGATAADAGPLRDRLRDLLDRTASARGAFRRNAGLGRLFGFQVTDFRGLALDAEARIVHASVV